MVIEQAVRIVAGAFVLLSLALGAPDSPVYHSEYWLLFTAFVGANLLQSGFTKFCPLAILLEKAGMKTGTL